MYKLLKLDSAIIETPILGETYVELHSVVVDSNTGGLKITGKASNVTGKTAELYLYLHNDNQINSIIRYGVKIDLGDVDSEKFFTHTYNGVLNSGINYALLCMFSDDSPGFCAIKTFQIEGDIITGVSANVKILGNIQRHLIYNEDEIVCDFKGRIALQEKLSEMLQVSFTGTATLFANLSEVQSGVIHGVNEAITTLGLGSYPIHQTVPVQWKYPGDYLHISSMKVQERDNAETTIDLQDLQLTTELDTELTVAQLDYHVTGHGKHIFKVNFLGLSWYVMWVDTSTTRQVWLICYVGADKRDFALNDLRIGWQHYIPSQYNYDFSGKHLWRHRHLWESNGVDYPLQRPSFSSSSNILHLSQLPPELGITESNFNLYVINKILTFNKASWDSSHTWVWHIYSAKYDLTLHQVSEIMNFE